MNASILLSIYNTTDYCSVGHSCTIYLNMFQHAAEIKSKSRITFVPFMTGNRLNRFCLTVVFFQDPLGGSKCDISIDTTGMY